MHTLKDLLARSELASPFVDCIETAVGDDIREDVQRNKLITTNSTPTRIWDFLNTNLTGLSDKCTIAVIHRGPWQMLVIYDQQSKCIFTFMREKRYLELKKELPKRRNMHYLDVLTKAFNNCLPVTQEQMSFFFQEEPQFDDIAQIGEKLDDILKDLKDEAEVIRHHVLVLFDASNLHLSSVRAAIVTPSLEIADEVDWTGYISHYESSVVEQVEAPNNPKNVPTLGLNLTKKAIERQKKNPLKRHTEEDASQAE